MTRYQYTPEDKRALAWCNEKRVDLGKKPVRYIRKGVPENPLHCPLAKTIGSVSMWLTSCRDVSKQFSGGPCFDNPKYVTKWLKKFDRGRIPHFIEGGTAHGC